MKTLNCLIAALLIGFAAIAQAEVQGSKHDFTSTGSGPITTQTELCSACHVPHNPKVNVPLWSHELTVKQFELYNENAEYAGGNSAAYDSSPTNLTGEKSRLCLSCHDGTVAVVGVTFITDVNRLIGNTADTLMSSHPVAVNYNTVKTTAPTKFRDIAADPDVKLDTNGKLQCTTCHNPHNVVPNSKMLSKSNTRSALCVTCHIK